MDGLSVKKQPEYSATSLILLRIENNMNQETPDNTIQPTDNIAIRQKLAIAYMFGSVASFTIFLIYLLAQLHLHDDNLKTTAVALVPQRIEVVALIITLSIATIVFSFIKKRTQTTLDKPLQHFWFSLKVHLAVCALSTALFSHSSYVIFG